MSKINWPVRIHYDKDTIAKYWLNDANGKYLGRMEMDGSFRIEEPDDLRALVRAANANQKKRRVKK